MDQVTNLIHGVGMLETAVTGEPPFWESMEHNLLESGPVYLLGRKFDKADGIDAVKKYSRSRLWFTYRKDFAPIGGTGPSSDQGWGCMLRCAQMLLGETLLRRHIGRHFEWKEGQEVDGDYEKILRMFFDEKTALYSIHQIAQMGVSEGKTVGQWFGPNTAAQVIKKLSVFDSWSNVAVHVALDNILVDQDVKTITTVVPPTDAVKIIGEDGNIDESHLTQRISEELRLVRTAWRPLLLILPLRLGLTTINKCYLPAIKKCFELETCVGIIGGRPNHALYFIGISGEKMIYLDPHYCRPVIKTSNSDSMLTGMAVDSFEDATSSKEEESPQPQKSHAIGYDDGFSQLEELEPLPSSVTSGDATLDDSTYHCQMLLYINYDAVDPSLALSFYCETPEEYEKLHLQLKEMVLPASKPPLFELLEKRPSFMPPFEPYVGVNMKIEMKDFDDMGAKNYEIDDGFEVLEN